MSEKTVVAVDALGGDFAPGVVLEGVKSALAEDSCLTVVLCGPKDVVEPFAASQERCVAKTTTEFIDMGEHPANAVRTKKDSSIVVGCRLVKEGEAGGFFSAGSTGACLAAATLVMGRIKGVARPALCTVVPSPAAPVVLCDVGANADCKPEYLLQFAQMATVYAREVVGIPDPKVGLLNIGTEEAKGSQFAQECHALLSNSLSNFRGNVEGKDVLAATCEVVVTDGFTGNVCLKTIEGASSVLFSAVKSAILDGGPLAKVGGAAIKGSLKRLKDQVSADTYGGAPLLGVKGVCIVGHGSSSPEAIKNGILFTAKAIREDVTGLIADAVSGKH